MAPITDIAATALTAFGVRQSVTANNIANLNTSGFTASTTVLRDITTGGVNATVQKGEDSVDISREAVDLITSAEGFKTNAKVLKTADEMTRTLLDIKA